MKYYIVKEKSFGKNFLHWVFSDKEYFDAFIKINNLINENRGMDVNVLLKEYIEKKNMFTWVSDFDLSYDYLYEELYHLFNSEKLDLHIFRNNKKYNNFIKNNRIIEEVMLDVVL